MGEHFQGRCAAAHEPRFHFHPYGLWSSDKTLSFHSPSHEGFISHSATNIHGTGVAFEATVRSLRSLMAEFGDDHVDLLKISAEGSDAESEAAAAGRHQGPPRPGGAACAAQFSRP